MNWLSEPFQYEFMARAFAEATLVAVICSVLGCYVVLRGLAFVGDALAHAVLPGIVVAYLCGQSLLIGALGAALISVSLIAFVSLDKRLDSGTATGVVFSGAFALGVALISRLEGYTRDLAHFLFGNILAVSTGDLLFTMAVGLLVFLFLGLFHRELMILSFDPVHARQMGLPTRALHWGLLVLIAFTVVSGIQAVGVNLITSLLITPAATARLLTERIHSMMLLSAALAVVGACLGLYLSYYCRIAAGASMVLVGSLLFALVYSFSRWRGARSS